MPSIYSQSFISTNGTQFIKDQKPYYFLGTNFWYGMNLGAEKSGDRMRLLAELDHLKDLGITNLRIMGASEGPDSEPFRMTPSLQPTKGNYNEDVLEGLDFLLVEMAKRDMTAVVCLNNFWPWSGGMAQYIAWEEGGPIPYPPPAPGGSWWKYMNFTPRFYKNKEAIKAFYQHIQHIVERKNSLTGQIYKNDPTIMSWQLANEPRGMFKPMAYRRWIKKTARFIKDLDSNHLVSIGSEGNTSTPTGNHFKKDHSYKSIDYTTIHIWIQNWQWYDPQKPETSYPKAQQKAFSYMDKHLKIAEQLNKPLVLEEFGIARDNNDHSPNASTEWRDKYFKAMFDYIYQLAQQGKPIAGCNFWAWGGNGRPRVPEAIWQAGDDFIGDPPHEHQGWYSVYDIDISTLELIREYASKMESIR